MNTLNARITTLLPALAIAAALTGIVAAALTGDLLTAAPSDTTGLIDAGWRRP